MILSKEFIHVSSEIQFTVFIKYSLSKFQCASLMQFKIYFILYLSMKLNRNYNKTENKQTKKILKKYERSLCFIQFLRNVNGIANIKAIIFRDML